MIMRSRELRFPRILSYHEHIGFAKGLWKKRPELVDYLEGKLCKDRCTDHKTDLNLLQPAKIENIYYNDRCS